MGRQEEKDKELSINEEKLVEALGQISDQLLWETNEARMEYYRKSQENTVSEQGSSIKAKGEKIVRSHWYKVLAMAASLVLVVAAGRLARMNTYNGAADQAAMVEDEESASIQSQLSQNESDFPAEEERQEAAAAVEDASAVEEESADTLDRAENESLEAVADAQEEQKEAAKEVQDWSQCMVLDQAIWVKAKFIGRDESNIYVEALEAVSVCGFAKGDLLVAQCEEELSLEAKELLERIENGDNKNMLVCFQKYNSWNETKEQGILLVKDIKEVEL